MLLGLFFLPRVIFALDTEAASKVIQRVDQDITVLNGFIDKLEKVESYEQLVSNVDELQAYLITSSTFYETIDGSSNDTELLQLVAEIKASITELHISLSSVKTSMAAGDKDGFESALRNYDQNIDNLNASVQKLNAYIQDNQFNWEPLLMWATIISFAISAALLFLSKSRETLPSEQLRNQYEFDLFKASLWPFVGSLGSYVWYLLTPAGGTFYVLTGPIVVGYIQFFRGIATYLMEHRQAIARSKLDDQAQLGKAQNAENISQAQT